MSWFLTVETESFLNTFLSLFGSEFADLDNVDIHGIWVSGLGRSREGLIGLVDRFGVLFGDFIGMFPLGLERDGFLISVIDGGGNSIHGYDAAHEGRGNASREISNKSILVSDAYKGGVVLEVGDILNKGWRIGVILPLGHVMVLLVVSWCMNAVSNFLMKSEEVLMEMIPPEMVFYWKVDAQVRADPLVM